MSANTTDLLEMMPMPQSGFVNRKIGLQSHPIDVRSAADVRVELLAVPERSDGQALSRTRRLALEPYMSGRKSDVPSYAPWVAMGDVMVGSIPDLRMKILMVLTSHDDLDNTGLKTGFWLEEFAAPYYVFKDFGAAVTLASPFGRRPPVEPVSEYAVWQTDATRRFEADSATQAILARTMKLRDVAASHFDAVFYPGGHGLLWDLAQNAYSIGLIEAMLAAGKPVAAVCQAPGIFRHVKSADGKSVVYGRAVTGFANTEEQAIGLTRIVPFLVEDMLTRSGGHYSKAADWQPHVVTDGLLITGQNPASSELAARALVHAISVPGHGVCRGTDSLD